MRGSTNNFTGLALRLLCTEIAKQFPNWSSRSSAGVGQSGRCCSWCVKHLQELQSSVCDGYEQCRLPKRKGGYAEMYDMPGVRNSNFRFFASSSDQWECRKMLHVYASAESSCVSYCMYGSFTDIALRKSYCIHTEGYHPLPPHSHFELVPCKARALEDLEAVTRFHNYSKQLRTSVADDVLKAPPVRCAKPPSGTSSGPQGSTNWSRIRGRARASASSGCGGSTPVELLETGSRRDES